MEHLRSMWRQAAMSDIAYRGVSLALDERKGVPILEALVKRQRNVADRLVIDAMAEAVKNRWWAAGAQESDEAGRWWTSRKSEAYDYSFSDEGAWMTLPVVMTASFSATGTGYNDGGYVWHLDAGHPVTITEFEACYPSDPQGLLDAWRGVTSPGNFDRPETRWDGDWVKLNIPPMRTTAAAGETTTMYRGVPAYLSPERKRQYLEACRLGQTRVVADLLLETLAEQAQNKNRWWEFAGDAHAPDEAGRWWAGQWFDAWGFGRGDGADDNGKMMIVPVILRAEIETKYVQGGYVAHIPAGTPLVIDRFQAPIVRADDKRRPKSIVNDPSSFVVLPVPPMRTTAVRKQAWGEDHSFTITTNTNMTAQKFVRWLGPDFNSAWVQPDGTVTACYTHAHVGDVATLLGRGWVRLDVMPNVGKVFVQATKPMTDDQIQSVRIVVIQSEASIMETSTGLGDDLNLHEHPVVGLSSVTKALSDMHRLDKQAGEIPYISREMITELLDAAEEAWGGFDRAYDLHPEFRALIGAAPGSMGASESYSELARALGR